MHKFIFVICLTWAIALPAGAESTDNDLAQITRIMSTLVPDRKPDTIRASVIPGLYEVAYGMQVIYVTADGRYLLEGDLIDMKAQVNLSDQIRTKGRLQVINKIPESSMIVYAPKKVKHTVTVFTDIDCGYCRRLHSEMDKYLEQGIKIRYLAYPRAGLESHSYEKAVSVWCAKDRQQALTTAKLGQEPEPKKCDNPVEMHYQAGRELNLSGTPMLVLEDGKTLPGYVPADTLAKMLEGK
ncbi:MAG: hypothetical protein A2V90_02720 [Gammaproteobacteria bacterium RBG_16_57_12]|nr:MAG: hypothetical protein A2V90_02720 [Gammaproteobacteria bacterium RBG_16_57_12]